MTHYLPIVVLVFAALLAVAFKEIKPSRHDSWKVKARIPVSPVEQRCPH